jgi:hypothetical protein
MLRHFVFAVVLTALSCCVPQPGPAPMPPDATDASPPVLDAAPPDDDSSDPASQACAHLRDLGCPLGSAATCVAVFSLDPKWGITPACVLRARGPAELETCHVICR